jgi:hypothetical protein
MIIFLSNGWPAFNGAAGTLKPELADGAAVLEVCAWIGNHAAVVVDEDALAALGVWFVFAIDAV